MKLVNSFSKQIELHQEIVSAATVGPNPSVEARPNGVPPSVPPHVERWAAINITRR